MKHQELLPKKAWGVSVLGSAGHIWLWHIFFVFLQPSKNVKTIPASQAAQKQVHSVAFDPCSKPLAFPAFLMQLKFLRTPHDPRWTVLIPFYGPGKRGSGKWSNLAMIMEGQNSSPGLAGSARSRYFLHSAWCLTFDTAFLLNFRHCFKMQHWNNLGGWD